MRLTYPSLVEPGTVVMHDKDATDVTQKFIMVDTPRTPAVWTSMYTVDLRRADRMEIYQLSQGGQEPRSIVEFYILRRKWTPYGYAKVWGSTPDCTPINPAQGRRPFNLRAIKEMTREVQTKQDRCAAWYRDRREIREEIPKDHNWMKLLNSMYQHMQRGN